MGFVEWGVAFGIAWDPYVARASSFVVVKGQRVDQLVSGLLAVVVLPWVGRRGGVVEVGEQFEWKQRSLAICREWRELKKRGREGRGMERRYLAMMDGRGSARIC